MELLDVHLAHRNVLRHRCFKVVIRNIISIYINTDLRVVFLVCHKCRVNISQRSMGGDDVTEMKAKMR